MTITNSITITAVPAGEAPEWVRSQWVGLVLPLSIGQATPIRFDGEGVLTCGKRDYASRFLRLFKAPQKVTGYVVKYDLALAVLEVERPEAAQWWRRNTSHLKGSGLIFEAEVCELS